MGIGIEREISMYTNLNEVVYSLLNSINHVVQLFTQWSAVVSCG